MMSCLCMKKSDFYFDLPSALIAQYPLAQRSDSRLFAYHRADKRYQHSTFKDLSELLHPGDLLVLNNSKVIPARFYGTKDTGGKVEFLIERIVNSFLFWAHIKASKSPKPKTFIVLESESKIEVIEKKEDLYLCRSFIDIHQLLEKLGHIPLPPYILRNDEALDIHRYQTVYALHKGSVAAPTAGLHFDEAIFKRLTQKGIE